MSVKYGLIFILLVFCSSLPGQVISEGNLVIVGGGLESNNISIFSQMIGLAGGTEKASCAIIPAASGVPMQSFEYFRNVLVSYGIGNDRIRLIPIAVVDDDSTLDVDEAKWVSNGNDIQLAETIRKCSAVWFSGGDQMRITKTLFRPDGTMTPVLEAIWDIYRAGAVVGGTSAGAAIMSDPMIGGGNSLAALAHGTIENYTGDDFPEGDGVLLTAGLGFFPYGMVDQHFDARARIGRLIVALFHLKDKFQTGYGIDENTALICLGKEGKLLVAGAGGVTIISKANAGITYHNGLPQIENLEISYLEDGDTFDPQSGIVIPAEGKKPTRGNEYYNINNPGQGGIFTGYASGFSDLITKNLIDNKGTDHIRNLSFSDDQSGFLVTLSKVTESEGFYTNKPDGDDHYTVIDIRMDVSPVTIDLTPINN